MHKIFWVSLSAALLAARLSGAAETTYGAELDRIEELVDRGNWVELRGFLRARPDLVEGDDAFSRELQNFLGQTSGLYSALIIDQVKYPDVKSAKLKTGTQASTSSETIKRDQGLLDGTSGDSLLEAELAALKGPPTETNYEAVPLAEGGDDPLLKSKKLVQPVANTDADTIEVAALQTTQETTGGTTRGRATTSRDSSEPTSQASRSVANPDDDGDFEDSEPDAAVTSARDGSLSIY